MSEKLSTDEVLREVNARTLPGRLVGYAGLSGPGWIQGAITLGASTATSSFYLGATFGYSMLWVQILGMLMGVVMFAAVARPALFREESIYRAMWKHVHPVFALAWVFASILGSIFWCLNQYSVGASCLADAGQAMGFVSEENVMPARWMIGVLILIISVPLTWTYGSEKGRGVRLYETILKCIVLFMVVCFAAVAWKTGIDWGKVVHGLVPDPRRIPWGNSADLTKILGALGCAVGINMTFLFPITLRTRGWNREYLGLARFDLIAGMFLPFAVIASLVVIATANMLHGTGTQPGSPAEVAGLMEPLFGSTAGRVLFDLGVAAMPLSTITILMLICGLAVCELLRRPYKGLWFKVGCLLPTVGILGVAYETPFWLGPLISSFALILLPIAYFGFMVLHNSRAYLGDDMTTGKARVAWNVAMLFVLLVTLAGAGLKIIDSVPKIFAGS